MILMIISLMKTKIVQDNNTNNKLIKLLQINYVFLIFMELIMFAMI